MLNPVTTTRFDKDVVLCRKRGKNLDHGLIGNYVNRRECHIEPDWLLIYKLETENIIFERTGTHADLFK